jgi:hypothetical protein
MSTFILQLLVFIALGLAIIIFIWMWSMEQRLKKFFAGTKAKNLEDVIIDLGKQMTGINDVQGKINTHLISVDDRLNKSIRRVETVRFNPFVDAGSNQSFALAFLNDEGDGVIISSLYARDRMSIFAKPVTRGKSEFELSTEEKEVLKKAK